MIFELDEELKLLRETTARMADEVFGPLAARWDRNAEPPLPNLKVLAQSGLAGILIPEEYGGSGATLMHAVVVVEEISRVCASTAGLVLGNAVTSEMLTKFGTPEHCRQWLPPLASGDILSAWAMTESEAGSAANEMQTRAVKDGSDYILNGRKIFITRGAVADIFILFARVGDIPGGKGIAAFLVEKGRPGFAVGQLDHHMGLRGGASCELIVENCRVPESNLLVPPGSFGRLMRGLNVARILNPTLCLGIAQEALNLAVKYSQERRQFGKEISSFQGIQWMLADMAVKVDAMRLLIYRAASSVMQNSPEAPRHAAIAKTYTNEAAFEVTNAALQIHGGYGYSQDFPLERMLRDVRAFQIAGGTTQILRNTIAAQLLNRRVE
jgi:alkylation response protein AidB-like acyl-CoA dehydrogenase